MDPFGERSVVGGTLSPAGEHALVSESLAAPFDDVRITAYLENPLHFEELGAVQAKFRRWGIALLIAGILAGVWLMIGTAQAEIRRARSGSEFAIGVSHDLRTPLASMKVLAESMYFEHVRDPTKQKAFLGTIVSECDRLGLLIERVLYLVRFGQDAIRYHLTDANIEVAVDEGVGACRARFSDVSAAGGEKPNQPAINVDIEPGLPLVKLDSSAFTQVLVNLLDNAVKYGSLGGAKNGARGAPLITVSVRREDRRRRPWGAMRSWVRLDVNDRGEGMDSGELKQIFRRFYRSERAGQLNLSGVGLGLSVCRHAAQAHGGWIEARSEKGQGSTFSVFFPAAEPVAT
jgi:two-component system phosphate regulon sensor histidine kinase PhoR